MAGGSLLTRNGKGGRRREVGMQGIDPEELVATVHMRRALMMSASAVLQL